MNVQLALDQEPAATRPTVSRPIVALTRQAEHPSGESSWAHLYAAFMQAPTIICVLRGPDHIFELANARCIEFLGGINPTGMTVAEAAPELTAGGLVDTFNHVYATGRSVVASELDVRQHTRGDDKPDERIYNLVVEPMRDPIGDVTRLLVYAIDITEQIKSRREIERLAQEASLRSAELSQLIEHIPAGVALFDRDGTAILANAAAMHIGKQDLPAFGLFPDQAGALLPRDAATGRTFAPKETSVARALAGEYIGPHEVLIRRPGEEEDAWLETSAVPLRDGEGRITGAVTMFTDVTEQHKFLRNISASEERLRLMHEAMACGVVIRDAQGNLIHANTAAKEILGRTDDEMPLGSDTFTDYAAIREDGTIVALDEGAPIVALRTGLPVRNVTHSMLRPDGERRWVHIDAVPIPGDDGKPVQVVTSLIDVTARKQAEEALRRQNGLLAALHETSIALMNRLDLNDLLEAIITRAAALAGADHGYVYLVKPGSADTMVWVAGLGLFKDQQGTTIHFGEGVAGVVWQTGRAVTVANYQTWKHRLLGPKRAKLRTAIGVPLKSGDDVVGVIGLAHIEAGPVFGSAELALMEEIARLASIALDNARLYAAAQDELAERTRAEAENARLFRQVKAAEDHLRQQLDFTSAITSSLGEGVLALDRDGVITFANPAAVQLLGWTTGQLLGRPLDSLLLGITAGIAAIAMPGGDRQGDPPLDSNLLLEALKAGRFARSDDAVLMRCDRSRLPVACSVSPIVSSGDAVGAVFAFHDIIERKAHTAALEHQALYDSLTSLPNRALLRDRLQHGLASAHRDGRPFALMIMDLDGFKDVNDTLGHHYGDLLLQQVGPRVQGALRVTDTVARLGGDEFAILLPSAESEAASRAAEMILKALEERFQIDDLTLHISASIGVAVYPEDGADAETLLRHADVAMYQAKRRKCSYDVYDPAEDQYNPGRLALLGDLRQALRQESLALYYQPQMRLADGRVTTVEALVRWPHPQYGLQSPDEFIPLAEQTGLIIPLTHWVLNAAVSQCAAWRRQGLPVGVSVNLSGRNLRDPHLPEGVAGVLSAAGLEPSALTLELAESAIADDPSRARQVLTSLHALGVRLSIDNFGTGYSSLAQLKRLPVDEIKLDRTFIGQPAEDGSDSIFVRATIELAHTLGLRVVAEGIEDGEMLERLTALGCDTGQGYFLGRPMPPEALTPILLGEGQPAVGTGTSTSPSR